MDENIPKTEDQQLPEPAPAGKGNRYDARADLYDWLQCIVTAMVACVLVFIFLFRVVNVVGSSMVPTLAESDKIIISNVFYTPKYGDIVVIRKESFGEEAIVKRVIATGGQTIDIDFDTGTVTVDGQVLQEDYIAELTREPENFTGAVTVPEGSVFVMGDNRNKSTDSRSSLIGLVDEREILGKALLRLFPLSGFGSVY